MLRSPTALVMMDSRSPVATVHAGMRSHLSFAFELNRAYACAHGYALLDSEDDAGAARRTAHHKESAGTVPQTPGLARWFSAPLCLMPWSAKVAAVNADAGAPLVFGECRQRRAHHQHWVKEAISGSESEGQFRLRLADTKLCMSAPRVAFA